MSKNSDFWKPAYLVFWLGLAIGSFFILKELIMMVICLVAAITLAAALSPLARYLEARKVPRLITVISVYLFVAALYFIVGANLTPVIKEQAVALVSTVRDKLQPWIVENIHELAPSIMPDTAHGPSLSDDMKTQLMGKAGGIAAGALKLTGNVMTFVVNILFVLFLTSYFVVESKSLIESLLSWLPPKPRKVVRELLPGLEGRLGGYVRGQLLVSLAVGTIIGIGLFLVGIKEALVLGVVAGFMNLVPFVGSLATAIFAILIGFNQSLTTGCLVILVFACEQWLESNFIVPQLLGKQVDMHPLVVLFSVLIGGSLLGLSGALIAVPLATASLYLAEELYLKKMEPENSPTA
ncbi:MAG TPA: AI-2E family transporter [Candidatus Obscuribacter sp.]|nr:AI-2E family transporter [Candidatus Obscuribacter sp.]